MFPLTNVKEFFRPKAISSTLSVQPYHMNHQARRNLAKMTQLFLIPKTQKSFELTVRKLDIVLHAIFNQLNDQRLVCISDSVAR